jgi:uncharacterized protein (TIGR03084 family)
VVAPEVVAALVSDLTAEQSALDAVVAGRSDDELLTLTPAEGWDVRDQLAHLAGFDEHATVALTDPAGFNEELTRLIEAGEDPVLELTERGRAMAPTDVMAWWREARIELLSAAAAADPSERVPWYGPPMSLMSFVTARLMETWAHGQDVVDALGVTRLPTRRLRHIADLGVRTRPFSYAARGLAVPDVPVLVRLEAPDGETWTWGSTDAAERITGPALDFCLVVTRRRHPDDTRLVADGRAADEWLSIAQAFAGPPTPGRPAGQFPVAAR